MVGRLSEGNFGRLERRRGVRGYGGQKFWEVIEVENI
jgi:hypothetical protein